MTGGKANRGIRMEYARSREPSVSQSEHTCPGEPAFLTSAAKGLPPMPSEEGGIVCVRRTLGSMERPERAVAQVVFDPDNDT